MSDSAPPIVKLTWPFVFGLLLVEGLSLALLCGFIWMLWRVPAPSEDAVRQIREALDAQVAAWNKGDLEGYMAGYWNDEKLSFYSGNDITTGWKPTLDRYRKRYQAEGKAMGQLSFSDVDVAMLSAEAARVLGRWKLTFEDGKSAEGLFTLIVRKFDDHWRVVHDHTSVKSP